MYKFNQYERINQKSIHLQASEEADSVRMIKDDSVCPLTEQQAERKIIAYYVIDE